MERAGNFTRPVRTEIIKNDAVVFPDAGNRFCCRVRSFIFLRHTERNHKFIVYAGSIRSFDAFFRRSKYFAVPQHHVAICLFQPFPPLVTVHSIITAADCRKTSDAFFLHKRFQILHIRNRALRRHIPAVKERMHEYFFQPGFLRHLQQRFQMVDMTVHAAVAEQSHQMQGTFIFFCILNRIQ